MLYYILGSFVQDKQVSLHVVIFYRNALCCALIHRGYGAYGYCWVTSSVAQINLHLR